MSAVWTESRFSDASCWTTPGFPGYVIEKKDVEPFYRVWAPVGMIGNRPKFAEAAQHVCDDAKMVSRAAQIDTTRG